MNSFLAMISSLLNLDRNVLPFCEVLCTKRSCSYSFHKKAIWSCFASMDAKQIKKYVGNGLFPLTVRFFVSDSDSDYLINNMQKCSDFFVIFTVQMYRNSFRYRKEMGTGPNVKSESESESESEQCATSLYVTYNPLNLKENRNRKLKIGRSVWTGRNCWRLNQLADKFQSFYRGSRSNGPAYRKAWANGWTLAVLYLSHTKIDHGVVVLRFFSYSPS